MSGAEDNNVENPNTVSADAQLTILAGICLDATPELKEVINLSMTQRMGRISILQSSVSVVKRICKQLLSF